MRAGWVWAWVGLAAAACDSAQRPATAVLVEVRSQLEALAEVQIDVRDAEGERSGQQKTFQVAGTGVPFSFAVVPRAGGALDAAFTVVATGRDASSEFLAEAKARGQFVPHKTLGPLVLELRAGCTAPCPSDQTCSLASGDCIAIPSAPLSEWDNSKTGSVSTSGRSAPQPAATSGSGSGGMEAQGISPPVAGMRTGGAVATGMSGTGGGATVAGANSQFPQSAGMSGSMATGAQGGASGSGAIAGAQGTSGAGAGAGAGGTISDPPTPLAVTALAPADDGTLDDPLASVRVTFSRPLRSETVNASTVSIVRNTAVDSPLAGTLAVNGDTLTFAPTLPWALAGTYVVRLGAGITDMLGRHLTPRDATFTVREGKWTTTRLSSAGFFSDPPDVAMSPNGNAVVAWYAPRDATGGRPTIWASRFAPGGAFSMPAMLDTDAPTFRVQTAINNHGHAVVAWDYADGVYASTFTGSASWNPRLTLDGSAYNPSIAITEDDLVYTALQFAHKTLYTAGIRFMADASTITPSDLHDLQSPTPGNTGEPKPVLAMLGGLPQVVWTQVTDTTASSIWWNAFSTSVCDTCRKQLSNGGAASNPRIASDSAQGAAIATWQQADPTKSNIAAARIVAGGQWSAPTILSDRAGAATAPAVAADATGHGLVVWKQELDSGTRILASTFTPGEGYGKSEIISAAVSDIVDAPVVALEAGGNAIAAWRAQSSTSATAIDVWAARYIAGRGWQAAARTKLSQTSNVMGYAAAAIDDSGRALVVWMDQDNIWTAHFE